MARLFGLTYTPTLGRTLVAGTIRGEFLGRPLALSPTIPFPADPAVALRGATATATGNGIPLLTTRTLGKGRAICLNIPFNYYQNTTMPDSQYAYWGEPHHNALIAALLREVLAAVGVTRPLAVDCPAGQWPFRMNVAHLPDGRAQYIGLTKGRKDDAEGTSAITLRPRRAGEVYDVLAGRHLGRLDAIPCTVNSVDVKLFAVLPYRVEKLTVKLAQDAIAAGGELRGEATLAFSGTPVRHVVNLQARRPDGQAVRYLTRNLELPAGSLLQRGKTVAFALPIAANESVGEWTLQATDVATGTSATCTFAIRQSSTSKEIHR